MALPVLVTVVGLGAAFVAVSRARAQMPGADPGKSGGMASNQPDAITGASVPADGAAAIAGTATQPSSGTIGDNGVAAAPDGGISVMKSDGLGVQIDPAGTNTGADPTTSPATPTADFAIMPADATVHVGVQPHMAAQLATARYANLNGVTMYQQAQALKDLGPAAGEVW